MQLIFKAFLHHFGCFTHLRIQGVGRKGVIAAPWARSALEAKLHVEQVLQQVTSHIGIFQIRHSQLLPHLDIYHGVHNQLLNGKRAILLVAIVLRKPRMDIGDARMVHTNANIRRHDVINGQRARSVKKAQFIAMQHFTKTRKDKCGLIPAEARGWRRDTPQALQRVNAIPHRTDFPSSQVEVNL